MPSKPKDLNAFLDKQVNRFNRPAFIEADPISIPHQFTLKQDIEITAFWTSILAWGRRATIINKANELFELMDNSPYDFICNHQEKDLEKLLNFKHRTFQNPDTLYFVHFLRHHYKEHESLESAFLQDGKYQSIEASLVGFRKYFFSLEEHLKRTEKHISSPQKKSTCKRLNMFLRWMVRKDDRGVDFGIWDQIKQSDLMIPYDVHVDRVARQLGLVKRKQRDWQTVVELSEQLKKMDPTDPAKYDYALFGMGVLGNK